MVCVLLRLERKRVCVTTCAAQSGLKHMSCTSCGQAVCFTILAAQLQAAPRVDVAVLPCLLRAFLLCSLDDATYATLSSLMLFNNVDVVLGLYQDAAFLPRVSGGHRLAFGCSKHI